MNTSNKLSGIYAITNLMNGKKYIGHSINIKKRWKQHRTSLNRGVSKHTHLQNAWNVYGKSQFAFSIIELLSLSLTKQDYEEVETKWVIHFKTNLSEFGYNSVLPGSFPLKEEGENITIRKLTEYVCINILSGEIITLSGTKEVTDVTSISSTKIEDLSAHWKGKTKRKSLHGWIIIKEEDYDSSFDYIGHMKERVYKNYKYGSKLTPTEYYRKRKSIDPSYQRSRKEDVIPHKDRNLKRCSIIAYNILTGEEKTFPMIKSCSNDFVITKVYKCINAPFGKYKHRGHYFRRVPNESISGV